jgi:hypothetical protein
LVRVNGFMDGRALMFGFCSYYMVLPHRVANILWVIFLSYCTLCLDQTVRWVLHHTVRSIFVYILLFYKYTVFLKHPNIFLYSLFSVHPKSYQSDHIHVFVAVYAVQLLLTIDVLKSKLINM